MQELKLALSGAQPEINSILQRYVGELPAGVRPVAAHILAAGGKRLRPFLTLTVGKALGGKGEGLFALGASVEMLHAATLLHDDILDNASLRRGKPAAHTLFDPATVVLAGDAMLAKSMLMVSAFGDTRLTDCISEAVMRTAEGEIAEFALLRNPELSHEQYLDMIIGKTAWMLRASCELGAIFSGADNATVAAASTFGLELGIAFQIVDDALDFSPNTGKPRGGDVREGKVTPPLLLYLASLEPEKAALFKERFARGSLGGEEAEQVCREVCAGGFDRSARETAKVHLDNAMAGLTRFPASAERIVLEQMLSYILQREN